MSHESFDKVPLGEILERYEPRVELIPWEIDLSSWDAAHAGGYRDRANEEAGDVMG